MLYKVNFMSFLLLSFTLQIDYSVTIERNHSDCTNYLPKVDLGEVDLSWNTKCEEFMSPVLSKCGKDYEEKVKKAVIDSNCDYRTESVKRVSCCAVWEAKTCVADLALEGSECAQNVSEQYRKLPSEPDYILKANDYCSEYMEDSGVCRYQSNQGGFTLNKLAITLVVLLALFVFILITYKFYSKYQKSLNGEVKDYNRHYTVDPDEEMQMVDNTNEMTGVDNLEVNHLAKLTA